MAGQEGVEVDVFIYSKTSPSFSMRCSTSTIYHFIGAETKLLLSGLEAASF